MIYYSYDNFHLGVKFYSDSRQKRHVKNLHQENSEKILSAIKQRQKRNAENDLNAPGREGRQAPPEPRYESDNIVKAR